MANRGRFQRGVLLLPSLFTLGNLFCGLFALRVTTDWRLHGPEHLERAAVFIAIAILLDGLDGKIARLAHATSPLGMQLDSLADVVSFGVAPGLLAYTWALHGLGNLGWAIALLFTACGAIRLARFNVQAAGDADNSHFVGLPIPAAAGAVAAWVFLTPAPVEVGFTRLLFAGWTLALSLLMVSTIRYHSFKKVDIHRRQPVRMLLWLVVIFAVVSWQPQASVASAVMLYTLSGPVVRLVRSVRSAQDGSGGSVEQSEAVPSEPEPGKGASSATGDH